MTWTCDDCGTRFGTGLDPALSCDRRNTSAMMTDLDAEEMGWGNESITGTD